jgi:hypothetical protein
MRCKPQHAPCFQRIARKRLLAAACGVAVIKAAVMPSDVTRGGAGTPCPGYCRTVLTTDIRFAVREVRDEGIGPQPSPLHGQ